MQTDVSPTTLVPKFFFSIPGCQVTVFLQYCKTKKRMFLVSDTLLKLLRLGKVYNLPLHCTFQEDCVS